MTKMMKLADKDLKITILTTLYMFKKIEEK